MKSKWADDEQDAEEVARRKLEKEEKKRAKAEKQRQQDEQAAKLAQAGNGPAESESSERPSKRRRLSQERPGGHVDGHNNATPLLRFDTPGWSASRSVAEFETLNPIEEGTYGFVSRARSTKTGEIVALKKLKLEHGAGYGFPVTALREIQTLQRARHDNIIDLKEVVVDEGSSGNVYLVMEFAAHDLKTLLEDMPEPFLPSEVKTLMMQLTSGVGFLHDNWILHRDLKTSNILLTSAGRVKIADFGMARLTSSPPPPNLTSVVVTLWYRSPELLLGATTYDFAVDMWSLGCVFGELLCKDPLLQGRNEVDQLSKTFDLVGIPTDKTWAGFRKLPNARTLRIPASPAPILTEGQLRSKFPQLTKAGYRLLRDLMALNPNHRPTAAEVLEHQYFHEDPRPKAEELLPSFPSKAGLEKRRRRQTPNAPIHGEKAAKVDFSSIFAGQPDEPSSGGFQLRTG